MPGKIDMRVVPPTVAVIALLAVAASTAHSSDYFTALKGVPANPLTDEQMQEVQGMSVGVIGDSTGVFLADGILHKIAAAIEAGERVALTGRNPHTGEVIQIPSSTQAKFKAGKALKDALN